jgi:hypothetical protein
MTTPIFAETSATSYTASQLGAAIGILLLGLSVIIAWRKVFGAEPPLHKEYATKSELREVHGRIKREREEIDRAFAQQRTDVKGLTDKLDDQTNELNKRIDAVPQRVIDLLLDAKELAKK